MKQSDYFEDDELGGPYVILYGFAAIMLGIVGAILLVWWRFS
jgi:hypothetical protein